MILAMGGHVVARSTRHAIGVLAVMLVGGGFGHTVAHAEVRTITTATISSTPTLALNVRALQVSVDTATGAGSIRAQFWTPVPQQRPVRSGIR